MKKVEAFKNSKGQLFEKESDYIMSEASIQRDMILANWKRLTEKIIQKPELYYQFIKEIAIKIIDKKYGFEDIIKEFDEYVEIFEKERSLKVENFRRDGDTVEHEPFMWGNDILPGFDVNR